MISVVNGFDVANKQALRDKWDIGSFEPKQLKGFEKKALPRNTFNEGKFNGENESRKRRNTQAKIDSNNRRKMQMALLQDYFNHSEERGRWVRLVEMSGTKVTASHISRSSKGESSIADVAEWEKIKVAINKFLGNKK